MKKCRIKCVGIHRPSLNTVSLGRGEFLFVSRFCYLSHRALGCTGCSTNKTVYARIKWNKDSHWKLRRKKRQPAAGLKITQIFTGAERSEWTGSGNNSLLCFHLRDQEQGETWAWRALPWLNTYNCALSPSLTGWDYKIMDLFRFQLEIFSS